MKMVKTIAKFSLRCLKREREKKNCFYLKILPAERILLGCRKNSWRIDIELYLLPLGPYSIVSFI